MDKQILIIDDSDHGLAGEWFAACIGDAARVTITPREETPESPADFSGIIITGSEWSVFEDAPWIEKQMALVRAVGEAGTPLLGVCFGHQLIFRALYGKDALTRRRAPEVGWVPVRVVTDAALFAGLPKVVYPYNFHTDEVRGVTEDWVVLASSATCAVHAVGHRRLPWWGLQFHPEVSPEEGEAGFRRGAAYLAGYGIDVAEVLKDRLRAGYYPEIILNFVRTAGS